MSKIRKKKIKKTNILLGFICVLLAILLGFILVTSYKSEQKESRHLSEIADDQQSGIEDYEAVKERAKELEEISSEEAEDTEDIKSKNTEDTEKTDTAETEDADKTEDTKDETAAAASGIVCWGDDLINGEESNTYSYMEVLQKLLTDNGYNMTVINKTLQGGGTLSMMKMAGVRHSFDRAHDIQEYGRVLTEHMPEIKKIATVLGRGEKVKELIEETAAELAFNNDPSLASGNVCYYYEKISMLPNFWAQTNNFKRLLSLFDRNLMFIRDVHDVCKKFNGLSRCKGNCKKCDAIHHPFSMLYKLGMLGIIPTSLNREGYVTQEFLDSTKVTYITGNDLLNVNNDCIYVLHPALTKSIDKLQRKKIKHFNLFVLGKGMSVPQDKLMQLVADYRNNTIKKSDFDSKYYSKQMKKD